MNKLLIHSNNTFFNRPELFPNGIGKVNDFVFDVDFDKDVDLYIDEKLKDGDLKCKIEAADVVFIKVSLSQNYLEYLGLRLAYHIRLTKSLGVKANIPIFFIAEESFQFLGLTFHEPSILFSGGIYLIKETIEDYHKAIRWFNEGEIKALQDFDKFVTSIQISPPSNYQSHHAIANEWALTRYFSMFEKDETNEWYNNFRKKVLDLDYLKTLHFKYIEAKASRQRFNPKKHAYTPLIGGIENMKLGIIDDEINKGWLEFYKYVLNKSKAQSIPYNDFRKEESKEELLGRLKSWLLESFKSSEPIDLFIIDLRLHDDDFSEQDFDNLSGIQIIRFIKSKNPGVQIVVATASNKVWNFQKCLEYGVKYFSIKESPETYDRRDESRASFIHFSKQITCAAEKSFLAGLFRDIKNLKKANIVTNHTGEKEKGFENLIFGKNGLLDQIFNLLILDSSNEAIINQCLLLSFQVLENYCDLEMVGSFGTDTSSSKRLSSGFVWLKPTGKKDIFINQPNQKISTWFELVYDKFDFQVEESSETPVSFKVFEKMELISSYKSGLDISSLVKMISVLHFRDNIPRKDIDRIIKLRYYRSNVAAHVTGKIKPEYKKIAADDIAFFIQIFAQLFI